MKVCQNLELDNDYCSRRMVKLFLCLGITFFAITLMVESGLALDFPGKVSFIDSPDGKYSLRNIDKPYSKGNIPKDKYDDSKMVDGHHLVFVSKDSKKEKPLCSYDRSVNILWCPDSSSFVLNEWVGSNVCVSSLYKVKDLTRPISIDERLTSSVDGKSENALFTGIDPLYVFASKWLGPKSLEIKASGRKNGAEQNMTFKWDLSDSFERIH